MVTGRPSEWASTRHYNPDKGQNGGSGRGLGIGGWGLADNVYWSLLLVLIPTVFFASITALLLDHGKIAVAEGQLPEHRLSFSSFAYYLWNLADAIPVLEVPKTLNWTLDYSLGGWLAGSLLLLYKLVLIVPFVRLLTVLFGARFAERESTDSRV